MELSVQELMESMAKEQDISVEQLKANLAGSIQHLSFEGKTPEGFLQEMLNEITSGLCP